MFCGMKSDDKELEALRKMAEDDKTPSHLRLGAIKELARRREAAEPEPLGDAQERIQAIVDRYCPQDKELRDTPQDPMVDLDFQAIVGREADPLFLSWVPFLPENSAEVERIITSSARRLGVGYGPYLNDTDELTARRRKRAG
jgi:hypothetical protein